ncbi:MAG: 2-oxo acid dehydrogenase subunit E2 [Rhodospirillaceae bacterium]|nr:2-oxo acid dehydrogenase subunit E2 [Rhodospirillaceae bacterium]
MAQERINAVTLPKWGLEMTEGTVAAWHVEEGAAVAGGEDLVDIETDKIVNTLDSEVGGLLWRRAAVGETFPIGALIAVIADSGVSATEIDAFVAGFRPLDLSETEPEAPPETQGGPDGPEISAEPTAAGPDAGNREAKASPFARRRAAELGVDLSTVAGTGRGGRISERDVEAAAAAQTSSVHAVPEESTAQTDGAGSADPAHETVAMSATRRTIARTLVQSQQTIPRFSVVADLQVDEMVRLRGDLKGGADTPQPTFNDYFIKATALVLADESGLNAHVSDSEITRFHSVNICFAVATEEGLVAPVVRDAAIIPITDIAGETARLSAAARARALTGADLEGGTFTVSNLGMFDVRQFDAIITPPQAAVLAIGAIRREPYEDEMGNIAFRSVVAATLSCDHRAVDGALAARFLQGLRRHVEAPAALAEAS